MKYRRCTVGSAPWCYKKKAVVRIEEKSVKRRGLPRQARDGRTRHLDLHTMIARYSVTGISATSTRKNRGGEHFGRNADLVNYRAGRERGKKTLLKFWTVLAVGITGSRAFVQRPRTEQLFATR